MAGQKEIGAPRVDRGLGPADPAAPQVDPAPLDHFKLLLSLMGHPTGGQTLHRFRKRYPPTK